MKVYILSAATLIFSITIGVIAYRLKTIAYHDAVEIIEGSTREYSNKISEEINVMMESARTMSHIFSDHERYAASDRDAIFDDILSSNLKKNPDYLSIGLYWEIRALDKTYTKKNGRIRNIFYRLDNQIRIQKEVVDTTNRELQGIYYSTRKINHEIISEPYYDVVTKGLTGTLMTSLLVPIQDEARHFEGLVGIDISLAHLNRLIQEIKPYEESVSYLVAGNRMIVAHSNEALTGKDFYKTLKADSLAFISGMQNVDKKSAGSFTYLNSANQEEYLVSLEPILINGVASDWIIGVEVPRKAVMKEVNKVFIQAIIAGFAGLILLYIIVYFIAWKISEPIVSAVEFAHTIASGNLNSKLKIRQNDEIGDLSESLSIMAARLTTIISEVIQSSDTIADGSLELLSASVKLSSGASQQAASSEEISSSVKQMVTSIQQNTIDAQLTEKIAFQATTDAQAGNEATRALIQSMNNIVSKVSIVGEIAKQTNLLAINAAIEASRYGIQGKGFSVVASEIKKLAERSQAAAKEINELSKLGLEQAAETEKMLGEIIPDIERTSVFVKKIARSSVEQKNNSEEISRGINELNSVTQQNADASFRLSQHSKNISAQAENLKKLIAYFKIEGLNQL